MFWNKWFKKNDCSTPQKPRLKPPIDLPQQVGRFLVVNLGEDPDWVWELKAVIKPVEGGKKSARHFRVYDPVKTAKQWIKVRDYHSLDDYPDLILYEGDFDRDTHAVSLSAGQPAKAA
jgi:hypothetical protein